MLAQGMEVIWVKKFKSCTFVRILKLRLKIYHYLGPNNGNKNTIEIHLGVDFVILHFFVCEFKDHSGLASSLIKSQRTAAIMKQSANIL
jgi:hypothetical protein